MIHLSRRKLRGMAETAAWLVGRRTRVRITGDSMLPTLAAGQFVLVDERRTPDEGELVLALHPDRDLLVVKRVESVTTDGRYVLASDNRLAGTDSRAWGPVALDRIRGTVTLLLDRPSVRL